jgi:hypothetical protein
MEIFAGFAIIVVGFQCGETYCSKNILYNLIGLYNFK